MLKPAFFRVVIFLAAVYSYQTGNAQVIADQRLSQASAVTQTIGISTVSVKYSRPSVNGREIWGKLVPYGWNKEREGNGSDAPWRAGANENTVLQLSHAATVAGHPVPAGSYGLFFVINKDNSGEVILSKDFKSWGNYFYDPKQDEMREKITILDVPTITEQLTYSFDHLSKNSAMLELNWEKKQFPVKIEFALDDIVLANAAEELKGVNGFDWQSYNSAAKYCLDNKVHLDQGLQWADQAIARNPNYTDLHTKAELLDLQGLHSEAEKVYQEALPKANELETNNYGYQLLAKNQFEKAIALLKANAEKYPTSANVWDSLGEAYALSGDKKKAILNFKKSLGLNPIPAVRANSEKYLKQLGAM